MKSFWSKSDDILSISSQNNVVPSQSNIQSMTKYHLIVNIICSFELRRWMWDEEIRKIRIFYGSYTKIFNRDLWKTIIPVDNMIIYVFLSTERTCYYFYQVIIILPIERIWHCRMFLLKPRTFSYMINTQNRNRIPGSSYVILFSECILFGNLFYPWTFFLSMCLVSTWIK